MDASLEDLSLRFEIDVKSACSFCEKIICGDEFENIEDFISYQQSKLPPNYCDRSWNEKTITAYCKECSLTQNSCICINCFLHGNHKGHNVSFTIGNVGNCDCGDRSAWNYLGFCSEHFYKKPEELPADLQLFLTNAFIAAFKHTNFLAVHRPETFSEICTWVKKFSDINSSFKALVSNIFFEKHINLADIMRNYINYSSMSAMALLNLLSSLTNDALMSKAITKAVFEVFPDYVFSLLSILCSEKPKKRPVEQLFNIFKIITYGFMHANIKEALKENIDWVSSMSKTIKLMFEFIMRNYNFRYLTNAKYDQLFLSITDLISEVAVNPNQHDNAILFSKMFFKELLKIEGFTKFTRFVNEKEEEGPKKESTSLHITFYISDILRRLCVIDTDEKSCYKGMLKFLEKNFWNDTFDDVHDIHFLLRPFLKPGVFGTEDLSLHIAFEKLLLNQPGKLEFMQFLYNYLREHHNNIQNKQSSSWCNESKNELRDNGLNSEFDSRNLQFNEFLLSFSILPLRFFAVHYQVNYFFQCNSKTFVIAINSFTFKGNINLRLMPLFALIQMMYGIVDDKEYAMSTLLHTFGIFEVTESKDFHYTLLNLLFFLSNLVTDRICLMNDLRSLEERIIALELGDNHLISATQIADLFWPELINSSFYQNVVDEVTVRITTDIETKFKLADEKYWNPIAPWVSHISNKCASFFQKNKDKLLPFTKFTPEPFNLNLGGLLQTRAVYAIIYFIASTTVCEHNAPVVSVHFILNLLIILRQITPKDEFTVYEIECSNLPELIEKIPSKFDDMLHCQIKYSKYQPHDLISLIKQLGVIGINVLKEISELSSEDVDTSFLEEERQRKKKAAQAARLNALKQIQQNTKIAFDEEESENETQNQINHSLNNQSNSLNEQKNDEVKSQVDDDEIENKNDGIDEICSICQTNEKEILWFPMTIYQSSLSTFVSSESNWNPVSEISASICIHLVHSKCVKNLKVGRNFICSADRTLKNCLLPKFPPKFSPSYKKELDFFCKLFSAHEDSYEKGQNISLSSLIELIVGLISTIEFRDRSNPLFSTKKTNVLLIKYLFRTIWYLQKVKKQQLREKSSPIWVLISKLVDSDDPQLNFQPFASIIKNMLKGEEENIRRFDRQVAILHNCIFNETINLPNPSNLRKNLLNIDFPNMFLEFILPKYGSIPVDKHFLEIGLCLMTGQIVYFQKNKENPSSAVSHIEYTKNNCGGLCPILVLTGEKATSVQIFTDTFSTNVTLRPFYLTVNGDENIGFESSYMAPYFKKIVYEKTMDIFFSGEWISLIESKDFVGNVFGRNSEDENNDEYIGASS
ncbi:hypothetical protein TRFO_19029 [Tritrichomonas foetus]|uniref:E3 ubiquitin-protein ligase n=1 Tax=Tritrichomonas foetus TaxID=1144522 RepID=A0A1J4KNW7_9EUKA|nr:hypothetical protein TRFO_19029 [Tritrichomonas foetus]|eukprot:OHT11492.1 hypothetical protein TRFO_19029 [Tritrichomonas foetus]